MNKEWRWTKYRRLFLTFLTSGVGHMRTEEVGKAKDIAHRWEGGTPAHCIKTAPGVWGGPGAPPAMLTAHPHNKTAPTLPTTPILQKVTRGVWTFSKAQRITSATTSHRAAAPPPPHSTHPSRLPERVGGFLGVLHA